ncbi:diguanylate cyclase [Treponema zuelzerae]|uniref:diguanylate cyclase n=1 Tax=Teretinema zuelzerae TaxID=156 RepID=A0AAE3EGM4_9SPIR|nr:GGDEF domain-containing protein [Teretinema zuelzerae]MCD1653134.1 diguanylate cyclase [Teretinema zuelzerae]
MPSIKTAVSIAGKGSTELQIYNIITFGGLLFSLKSTMLAETLSLSIFHITLNALFIGMLALLYFRSRVLRRLDTLGYASLGLVVLCHLPVLWFTGGGVEGGTPLVMLLVLTYAILLASEASRRKGAFITYPSVLAILVESVILFHIEYIRPDLILRHGTQAARMWDTGLSMLIVMACQYVILTIFIRRNELRLRKTRSYSRELERLVSCDAMTGLLNHCYGLERLQKEIQRARRHGYPLSLVMIDLDFFKRINDSLGHAAGDRVIISIADAIKRGIRTEDCACRYGGEEFILILPHTELQEAEFVTERVAEILYLDTLKNLWPVTLSAGIAMSRNNDTANTLIDRADALLYRSKREGRNRITLETSQDLQKTEADIADRV